MTHLIRSQFFIEQLATLSMIDVFNPWKDTDPLDLDAFSAASDRRARLLMHFDCSPQLLLIGEAPGYQGCHFSGVPFTNEALIIDGAIPRVTTQRPRITDRRLPWREPSATIVWGALHSLGIAERTVMWNAFAFHPFERGNLHSNRKPKPAELIEQSDILRQVLKLFDGVRVIAVGNVAEWSLCKIGVKYDGKIRHPANGGATEFREQLAKLCGKEQRLVGLE